MLAVMDSDADRIRQSAAIDGIEFTDEQIEGIRERAGHITHPKHEREITDRIQAGTATLEEEFALSLVLTPINRSRTHGRASWGMETPAAIPRASSRLTNWSAPTAPSIATMTTTSWGCKPSGS